MSSTDATAAAHRPALRVIRGDATDDEIAALLAVLSALSSARRAAAEPPAPSSGWNDRAAAIRRPLPAGPGAWRASARPR